MFCGLFVVVLAGFNLSCAGYAVEEAYGVRAFTGEPLFSGCHVRRSKPILSATFPPRHCCCRTFRQTAPHCTIRLSLATTYAGNLLTIGSIANLIVIEQARLRGVTIRFRDYACAGVPVTLATFAILLVWIRFCTCMGW